MAESSRSPAGVCILGCGGIARRHARAILGTTNPPRLFFASRSDDKAEKYRRDFQGDGGFGSYEKALSDPRVHAVVICTPHHLHVEHARLAAVNGVHILMEKPLARTPREADEIIRVVRQSRSKTGSRCFLMVAENFRFKPSVRKARRLMEDGVVGKLKHVRVKTLTLASHGGWRRSQENMGGGAFIDGGIHWVDTVLYWAGPAKSVYAVAGPQTNENVPFEDTIHVLSEHENGVVGELTHSWGVPGPGMFQFSSINGSKGTLYIENHGYFLYLTGNRRRFFFSRIKDWAGFVGMQEEFCRAVDHEIFTGKDGVSPDNEAPKLEMSGEEGRRALEFVSAAYQSFQEGRRVILGS